MRVRPRRVRVARGKRSPETATADREAHGAHGERVRTRGGVALAALDVGGRIRSRRVGSVDGWRQAAVGGGGEGDD